MTRKPSTRSESDEDLVRRAQHGCHESFDEVMKRYQAPLLHFLRARSAPAEAEDLLQDAFLRAYRGLSTYRSVWTVRTWLFTIARRVCIDSRRRRQSTPLEFHDVCGGEPEASEVASAKEERRTLWAEARRLLSELEQTSLWLHYVEEMPISEVAAIVGRSPTATKVMMFRARRTLAEHLPAVLPGLVTSATGGGREGSPAEIANPSVRCR